MYLRSILYSTYTYYIRINLCNQCKLLYSEFTFNKTKSSSNLFNSLLVNFVLLRSQRYATLFRPHCGQRLKC